MMKFNRTAGIFGLALLFSLGLIAQGPVRDRIKTLKVAFITERLALTSAEAQDFWPIYNAHEDQVEKLRRKERQRFGSQLLFLDDLSESEAVQLLSEFKKLQVKKHQIEQTFITDLGNVLPAKKIILLFKSEEDFKKRLLQRIGKRRG